MRRLENKNKCPRFLGLSQSVGSFLEHLVNILGDLFMPLVNLSGYGFPYLFNDLADDFYVLYLRGLHGFDLNGHFVTSLGQF